MMRCMKKEKREKRWRNKVETEKGKSSENNKRERVKFTKIPDTADRTAAHTSKHHITGNEATTK